MIDFRLNWRLNMVGPPWFRRLRTAWAWYRSGDALLDKGNANTLVESIRQDCISRIQCEQCQRNATAQTHDNSTSNWWGWNPHG